MGVFELMLVLLISAVTTIVPAAFMIYVVLTLRRLEKDLVQVRRALDPLLAELGSNGAS